MEIECSDGTKTLLKPGWEIHFGRGLGFKIDDRTVSRRHVSFQHHPSDETRVCFQVTGKNPIWVHSSKSGQVSTFRTCESGEMEMDDMFCVSAKNPIWFTLKKAECEGKRGEFEGEKENSVKRELGLESELAESLESSCGIKDVGALEPDSIDISHIDPFKEFGFLVKGQEFDGYPKKMIRDIKNWDWFIGEPRVDTEDDEFEEKRKAGGRRNRKKGVENEDDEWTGESEEEKERLTKTRKVQRPNYLTRSKDRHKHNKDTGKSAHPLQQKSNCSNIKNIDDEEEDDDDETLGGFIVDSDALEQEEEIKDEEEEDFDEDEDDDELND